MKSQVTTKQGDSGFANALSGDRFPKSHPIMECVGTVDELRTHLARIRLRMLQETGSQYEESAVFLLWLLHTCFLIGATCSDCENKHPEYRIRDLLPLDLDRLEAEQMRLEAQTPLPHHFVVSATHLLSADVDIACTVARRLERSLVRLKEATPAFDAETVLCFMNRLSDYLFILARHLEHPEHHVVDYTQLATGQV